MRVIHYENWRLWAAPGPAIARQYDNLTRRLEILGDIPEGWSWTLLVQADREHLDLIALRPMEGGLGVDLTAEMLALSGYYTIQLRGNQGELARHTNQVRIFIPSSLSGDANWPELPSEFSQAEARIRGLNEHPPYPGDAGYWMVWDVETDTYIQSPLPLPPVAEGPAGKAATIKVGETVTGDPGTQAAVENTGTENGAVLRFTIPRGAVGPTGATPAISVEVTSLPAGSEPTVEVSGTPETPVISLGIPQGKQGDPGGKGDPGDPGQTPNITIGQVETLPAGSAVTASITGETPNLVLNLGIPQGKQGDPGQAATIEIVETETVAPDTPAAMVELRVSTPQARRYKAKVPQGIQGPAGLGVPPISGPEDAGKVPTVNGDGTGYVLEAGGSGGDWALVGSVTTEEEVAQITVTLNKPCKEIVLVVDASQLYSDGSAIGTRENFGNIRINNQSLCGAVPAGGSVKVKSQTHIIAAGGTTFMSHCLAWDKALEQSIYGPTQQVPVNEIDSVSITPKYKFVANVGHVGRFAIGSSVEVYGR